MKATHPPLIITAWLDQNAFLFFDALRKEHFPVELNYLRAHLTLFHHLPNTTEAIDKINAIAAATSTFSIEVSGLMSLGNGVAYKIASDQLVSLHKTISTEFTDSLTNQDRAKFNPHVTVQNKTSPIKAKELLVRLSADFNAFSANLIGLQIHEYLNGPWKTIAQKEFKQA